jgi:hypothetical protein
VNAAAGEDEPGRLPVPDYWRQWLGAGESGEYPRSQGIWDYHRSHLGPGAHHQLITPDTDRQPALLPVHFCPLRKRRLHGRCFAACHLSCFHSRLTRTELI